MSAYNAVPAEIAGNVNLLRFSEALARAGIVGRFDPDRGVLVLEPAKRGVAAASLAHERRHEAATAAVVRV